MQTRLLHVRANVHNLNRAIEWYSRILGFEVKNRWPPEKPNYADFMALDGAVFAIMEAEPVSVGARFNFSTQDVDALWESLIGKVEIVEPLFDTAYGTRKFTIHDLDGNELGFVKG